MVLVLVGAFTKSAQYPFHAWLPGAMAAPTPVSAYLHSATMVTAGVYLVARLAPAFASVGPAGGRSCSPSGCATMVFGGLRALRQHDLKLLLAFGTVSQLGFMMVLFGAGTPAATTAGWMLLVAHAAFKAALFMVVGHHRPPDRHPRHPRAARRCAAAGERLEVVSAARGRVDGRRPLGAGFIAKELAYDALGEAAFALATSPCWPSWSSARC